MKSKKLALSCILSVFLIMALAGPLMALDLGLDNDLLKPVLSAKLVVTPATQTINVGETASYTATYYPIIGTAQDVTASCVWAANGSDVAEITDPGKYLGLSAGTTTLRALYEATGLVSNDAELVVIQPGQDTITLTIKPVSAEIYVGQLQQYRAYLQHSNGSPDEDVTEECTWGIEDPIASPTANKGEYLGVTVGDWTNVTANYVRASQLATAYFPPLNLKAEARLRVVEQPRQVLITLEVTPPTASIMVGESQQYKAVLHFSDGSPDQDVTNAAAWSLSNAIATPTAKGLYKGTARGTATVTAKYTPSGYSELSDDAVLIVDENGPPPTENLPEGKMIDRQPGYITLCNPQNLGTPADEFTMSYDASRLDGNPDRHPKVFYWNSTYKKWVALASYPLSPGTVKALNDGHYSGWFVVMGCIQPSFTDVSGSWAEKYANRMNGLGLLEGYPNPANLSSLTRPAGLDRVIIRSELTATVARILGLSPGDTHLYPTITYLSAAENDVILNSHYADADEILPWARPYIAAMTKAGLVSGKGGRFAPNDELTRIEAAVIISNALRDVPGFGTPADLTVYTDFDQVPDWAVGKVAQGTIHGYPDGSLRPNQPITRAEAESLLLTLLRGLGW